MSIYNVRGARTREHNDKSEVRCILRKWHNLAPEGQTLVLVNLKQPGMTWEENINKEFSRSAWPVVLWVVVLIVDWCRKTQFTMGSIIL